VKELEKNRHNNSKVKDMNIPTGTANFKSVSMKVFSYNVGNGNYFLIEINYMPLWTHYTNSKNVTK